MSGFAGILRSVARRNLSLSNALRKSAACGSKPVPVVKSGADKLRALQDKFQKDDGKPVFLKGGVMDNVLYRSTWALCLIGLLLDVKLFLHYILM